MIGVALYSAILEKLHEGESFEVSARFWVRPDVEYWATKAKEYGFEFVAAGSQYDMKYLRRHPVDHRFNKVGKADDT